MTHPDVILARANLRRLAVAWDWLGAELEPGPTTPRGTQVQSAARVAVLAKLHRDERGERRTLLIAGTAGATGHVPAPLRVAVLDARVRSLALVCEAVWMAGSALRRHLQPGEHGPALFWRPIGTDDERFAVAVAYLLAVAPLLPLALCAQLGHWVGRVDQAARGVLGVGDDRRPLDADCPACGRHSLVVDVSAQDQMLWTVTCRRDCRCSGVECGCGLPGREAGRVHIWPRSRFRELAWRMDRIAEPQSGK